MGFILGRVFKRCVRKSGDRWCGGRTNVGGKEKANKKASEEKWKLWIYGRKWQGSFSEMDSGEVGRVVLKWGDDI